MVRIALVVLMISVGVIGISAQQGLRVSGERLSENEIKVEDLYIQASQKKLLGKYDDALKLYEQLLKANEVNPAVHHDMARIYHAMDKKESAVSSARKAVKYDESNPWYLLTLAQIYEESIEPGLAADVLKKVINISPHQDLYQRWAIALDQAGNKKEAIQAYDQADQKYGWSEDRSDSKVDLYLALKMEKEANKELEKWVEKYPRNVDYLIKLARYYEFRDKSKKSLKTYEKALLIDPDNEEALFKVTSKKDSKAGNSDLSKIVNDPRIGIDNKIKQLVPLLNDNGRQEEVIILCQSLVKQYPDDPKPYALYGDVLWLKGDANGAISQYEKSLDIKKSIYQVWDQLMMAVAEVNDYDKLTKLSNTAIDYYPNQAGPYYYNGLALMSQGKVDKAKGMNEEALFIAGPNSGYISEKTLMMRATIQDNLGETKQAVIDLNDLDPSHMTAGLLELLGDLYVKTGDKVSAERSWKASIAKGGDQRRINLKIESI